MLTGPLESSGGQGEGTQNPSAGEEDALALSLRTNAKEVGHSLCLDTY